MLQLLRPPVVQFPELLFICLACLLGPLNLLDVPIPELVHPGLIESEYLLPLLFHLFFLLILLLFKFFLFFGHLFPQFFISQLSYVDAVFFYLHKSLQFFAFLGQVLGDVRVEVRGGGPGHREGGLLGGVGGGTEVPSAAIGRSAGEVRNIETYLNLEGFSARFGILPFTFGYLNPD